MPKVTIAKRKQIVDEQSHKKFHKIFEANEKKIIKLVEKDIQKKKPNWITKKMIESGFIKKCSSFEFFGEPYRYNNSIRLRRSTFKVFPTISDHSPFIVQKTPEIISLIKERKVIIKDKQKFIEDLNQVILSYGTDKNLVKAVPELAAYFANTTTALTVIPDEKVKSVRKILRENEK